MDDTRQQTSSTYEPMNFYEVSITGALVPRSPGRAGTMIRNRVAEESGCYVEIMAPVREVCRGNARIGWSTTVFVGESEVEVFAEANEAADDAFDAWTREQGQPETETIDGDEVVR